MVLILAVLVLGIGAFPSIAWFLAGLIGLGIGLLGIMAVVGILAVFRESSLRLRFFLQFFSELLPGSADGDKQHIRFYRREPPLQLSALKAEEVFSYSEPPALSSIERLRGVLVPKREIGEAGRVFFEAIPYVCEAIVNYLKEELQKESFSVAVKEKIGKLIEVCGPEKISVGNVALALARLDYSLQACLNITNEDDLLLQPVLEKVAQYKEQTVGWFSGNPRNIVLLIDEYKEEKPYALLLSKLSSMALEELAKKLDCYIKIELRQIDVQSLGSYLSLEEEMRAQGGLEKLQALHSAVKEKIAIREVSSSFDPSSPGS